MVDAVGNTISRRPFSLSVSGLPPRPSARDLLDGAVRNGTIDGDALGDRLATIAKTDPDGARALRNEIEPQLTPVQRGQLAAKVDGTPFGHLFDIVGPAQPSFAKLDPTAVGIGQYGMSNTGVTAAQIRKIMPGAGKLADWHVGSINREMAAHGIVKPEQQAAFLAQVSVETGNLKDVVEDLNYSAARLTKVWPSRYPTTADAQPYAHNPEALGNNTYANRMGNGDEASGDGYLFRGRGLLHVTGRAGYRAAGYENNPGALENSDIAASTAASFWQNHGLNARTDSVLSRAEFNGVSRTVNGGDNGKNERWSAYQRALRALDLQP